MENGNLITSHIISGSLFLMAILVVWGAWRALARYRHGEFRAAKTWLFVMLGLGGPWVAALAFAANFGYMQKPQFCFSCHIMKPFYHDLRDPKSEGLAALHYQNNWVSDNACYECHTDYGAFGGVKAKLNGLKHAYVYYLTNKKGDPELYKPYRNENCMRCHGGDNRRYKKIEEHVDGEAEILSNETSCLECHETIHMVEKKAALESLSGGAKVKRVKP